MMYIVHIIDRYISVLLQSVSSRCVLEKMKKNIDRDVPIPALHHGIKTVDLVTSQMEGGVYTHTHTQLLQPPVCLLSEMEASC